MDDIPKGRKSEGMGGGAQPAPPWHGQESARDGFSSFHRTRKNK